MKSYIPSAGRDTLIYGCARYKTIFLHLSFVFFIAFLFTGCSYFFQGRLEISVTSNQEPLADAQLILYGKNKNKEMFIRYLQPNSQGKVVTTIDFSKYQSLKVVATSTSLEKLSLPDVEFAMVPQWWEEQLLQLKLDLPRLETSQVAKNEIPTKTDAINKEILEKEDIQAPEVISISQLESDLYERLQPANQFKNNILSHSTLSNNPIKNIDIKKTITENKVDYLTSSAFKIMAENSPVENARIFIGYNASQAIKSIGETDKLGELSFSYNKALAPDILIVKKPGFITSMTPFIPSAGSQPLSLELKAGKSLDYLVQNYAYGVGRGLDKTELFFNGAKQEVSTVLGFLTFAKELKGDDILSIEQKNSIISSIPANDLKKAAQNKPDEIVTLFLPPITPFRPTVGFIEPDLTGNLESNMLWRRARREFFSRFINEQSFKTKIPDDLKKITNAGSIQSLDLFKHGWENSNFAKDVDMIMQIDFSEDAENPTLIGRIYTKNGQIIAEQKSSFNITNAEQVASQMYHSIMSQLPIEAYVTQQEKGVFTLNVGKNQHISTGDLFAALIPQEFYSVPNKAVGVFKVTEVLETESKAIALVGIEKLQHNISIRAIRTPQPLIENEIKKQIAERLSLKE